MFDEANFIHSDLYQRLLLLVAPAPLPVYLVGGGVRDLLCKRPIHDLDFALHGNPGKLARRVADALDGAFYMLDEERETARVILNRPDGERLFLDFALLRADNLEMDLRLRDFTINAMAFRVEPTPVLIDPLNGAQDLRNGIIRACSVDSLLNDPVRILRGIRMAVQFEYRILPETLELMQAGSGDLRRISAERIRDEVVRMFGQPRAAAALRLMQRIGALGPVLPDLAAMQGVKQSPPHVLDVWEHTLATLEELEKLFMLLVDDSLPGFALDLQMEMVVARLGRYRTHFKTHYTRQLNPDRELRALLFLAALYHDVGKQATRIEDADGRARFIGHEDVSAELATRQARDLALSQDEIQRVEMIIREHMRVHFLARDSEMLNPRKIYRYFRKTGEAGVDICLLSLADTLATYGPTLTTEQWAAELEVCGGLLQAFWEFPEKTVDPPRLITGSDLINLYHLTPGPQIGKLLEAIREAQASGEIHDREDALEMVRRLLET